MNNVVNSYGYIRAPSAVIETALICKLKASVIHDRAGLGLNSHHISASPCPSSLGHARPTFIEEESDHFPTNPYADDFTVFCSNSSNVHQMAAALSAHASNIEEWADERGLAISVPKSTIILFILFCSSFQHPSPSHLSNSILPLERNTCILGVTFDPHFKFNAHVRSLITRVLPRINILKVHTGTNWGQQKETILITLIRYVPNPVSFHVCSSHLISQHLTIPYLENPNYPKLCPPHSHRLR